MEYIYLQEELVALSSIYIESTINSFLYIRSLYPPSAFESKQFFGIPLKVVREQRLKSYISNFMQEIETFISNVTSIQGILYQILILVEKDQQTEEVFTITLDWKIPLFNIESNEQIRTPTDLQNLFKSSLMQLYENSPSIYDGEKFKLLIRTRKEEALEGVNILESQN